MDRETFAAVDEFVGETLIEEDEALAGAVRAAEQAGLPAIHVSPAHGKLLWLLASAIGARRVLEVGTLGGYSTIWLARALPEDGRVLSLEASEEYAEVARRSIAGAGLAERVEVRVGPALETMVELEEEGVEPFDLVFVDADKVNTPNYMVWALGRTRPGGLILADNVVRDGGLAAVHSEDASIEAQRHLHRLLADDPRAEATTIQTVGVKGYDGFTLIRVTAP